MSKCRHAATVIRDFIKQLAKTKAGNITVRREELDLVLKVFCPSDLKPKGAKVDELQYAFKPNKCPVCGDWCIDGGSVEVDHGGAQQEVHCTKCGSDWVDRYTLTGYDLQHVGDGT
jgi:hypothetical protein